jgi:cell division protease FtsH
MDEDVAQFAALFRRFLEEVVHGPEAGDSPLRERLREHLGSDPLEAPITGARLAPFEHPDLQVALDAYVAAAGRSAEVIGAGTMHHGPSLADALVHDRGPIGAPSYVERPVDVHEQLACLRRGVVLVSGGEGGEAPHALVVSSEDHGPFEALSVDVVAADRDLGRSVLTELRRLMAERSVYRGKVLTLSNPDGPFGGGRGAGATFLPRPDVPRERIILPPGRLEPIERRTVGFDAVAGRLAEQGLSRKRGILLYGPPGTGKTLTVQHLIGRMEGRTVVVLTGQALGAITAAVGLARRLQPAMIVCEDVDLVAHDRSFDAMGNPVLLEMLNALDGLGEDDADVVVLLTTNRADLLEPALAARPGRVDLAVELPLPDADERHRLIELYAAEVAHRVDDWSAAVERTEGTPASFIGELLRSAALLAAERGADALTGEDVDAALTELLDSGPLTAALLGARWGDDESMLPPGPSAAWAVAHGSSMTGFVTLGELGGPDDAPFLTDEL